MDKNNLVVLKGSKPFSIGDGHFLPNTYYRCLPPEKPTDIYLIWGYGIVPDQYIDKFEFVHDRIIRDWTNIGLIVNSKPISKTAFARLANIHTYGNQKNNLRIYFFGPKECQYGFYPLLRENRTQQLVYLYEMFIETLLGDMTWVDDHNIQFGNCGTPIGYGNLRVS